MYWDSMVGWPSYQQLMCEHRSGRGTVSPYLVKNSPGVQETPVRFLGQEDPLEKGSATHSSILGLPWWLSW